ncbi:MAG: hypothetical protein JW715_15860 [Sedimentisphaerales bacterium]|nr:hypothetical protein [Sedimentisphaerales bacterium]
MLIAGAGEIALSSERDVQYTAKELIEKIIESENKIKDVQADYLFFEPDTNLPLLYAHWAYQPDKELLVGLNYEKAGNNLGYTVSRKVMFSLDGKQRFNFFEEDILRGRKGGSIRIPNQSDFDTFNSLMTPNSLLGFDIACGTRNSFGQSLQRAQKVTLRERTEQIDGHKCSVLEAIGIMNPEFGFDAIVWIDIERDYRPLKVEIFYNTILGGRKYQPFERLNRRIHDIVLKNIDGIWFPIEGKRYNLTCEEVLPPELEGLTEDQARQKFSEEEFEKISRKIKNVAVLSVPPRKALLDVNSIRINKGIDPNTFVIKSPNGCEVFDEIGNKRYIVENRDETHLECEVGYLKLKRFAPRGFMKVIYPDTLTGCNLEDLTQIKIDLDSGEIRGKPLLLCIWDMQQRPSRNCILQLSERAQELKVKDIVTVAVQASKVEQAKLDEWIKENNITFAVGMIQDNQEQILSTWGVKSLPRLILTDKKHVVTAEGFSLDELDKQIIKSGENK